MFSTYDVIVVGAGHAGCEAAHAAAKMGSSVLLVTMNMNTIYDFSLQLVTLGHCEQMDIYPKLNQLWVEFCDMAGDASNNSGRKLPSEN